MLKATPKKTLHKNVPAPKEKPEGRSGEKKNYNVTNRLRGRLASGKGARSLLSDRNGRNI